MARLPSVFPDAQSLGERPSPQPAVRIANYRPLSGAEGVEGAALAQVGADLGHVGSLIEAAHKEQQDKLDSARAEDAINSLREKQLELTLGEANGFQHKKGGDVVNRPLFKDYRAMFDDQARLIGSELQNDQQREKFGKRAAAARLEFSQDLLRHVTTESEKYTSQVNDAVIQTEVNSAASKFDNPGAILYSSARIANAISAEARNRGWSPEQTQAAATQAQDRMLLARLDAQRVVDPAGALSTFQANAEQISPRLRYQLGEQLFRDAAPVLAAQILQQPLRTVAGTEGEARALAEIADTLGVQVAVTVDPEKAGKSGTLFDRLPADQKLKVLELAKTHAHQGMAQMRESLRYRTEDATAALERGQPAPNAPTSAELVTAFGPEHGTRITQQIEAARVFGDDVSQIALLPRSQQAALLTARQPKPEAPGYAEEQRRQDQFAGAIDRVRAQQDKDPALFVTKRAPIVQGAYQEWQAAMNNQATPVETRAAAAQGYAQATIAEQHRLEIPNVAILPKEMVDEIARRFAAPPSDGMNTASVMRDMTNLWGPYWPTVGRQLKGVIPAAAVVIGLGVRPEAEQLISEAMKLKPEELHHGIPSTDIDKAKDLARGKLSGLMRTLAWQNGGQDTYDKYADTTEMLAIMLMKRGDKPEVAAEKAFQSLVGFKYEFRDTWRVPKAALDTGVTVQQISDGSRAMRFDIAESEPLYVPLVRGSAARPEDLEKQWRQTISDSAFWVTSPGDGGLTLYAVSGLGAQPIVDPSGRPITRTWEQLNALGRQMAPATTRDTGGWTQQRPRRAIRAE